MPGAKSLPFSPICGEKSLPSAPRIQGKILDWQLIRADYLCWPTVRTHALDRHMLKESMQVTRAAGDAWRSLFLLHPLQHSYEEYETVPGARGWPLRPDFCQSLQNQKEIR